MLRNAQLSQENESFKRKTRDQLSDLEMELQQKNNSVAGLEDILQEMQAEAKLANQKVRKKRVVNFKPSLEQSYGLVVD